MRRMLLLPLALVAALVVTAGAAADTKTVQITRTGFVPAATTAVAGDTVTWKNADSTDHQVVANDGSFASPILKSGESYSFTFQKAGKTTYHDSFATTRKGTVTVTAPPAPAASVTLSADAQTVVYGNSTSVNGIVTNQVASGPVSLTAQPNGKGAQSIATATTQANGAFTFNVSPTIQTSYQAHWKTTNSPSVMVNVAPRVGFGRIGRQYNVKVTSDLNYSGNYVVVQRKRQFGGWTTAKRVFLNDNSRALFPLRLVKGRSFLRVVLPQGQAGAGYVSNISRQIIVVTR
jgi:plastocyanin